MMFIHSSYVRPTTGVRGIVLWKERRVMKRLLLFAALLVACAALTGCGGDQRKQDIKELGARGFTKVVYNNGGFFYTGFYYANISPACRLKIEQDDDHMFSYEVPSRYAYTRTPYVPDVTVAKLKANAASLGLEYCFSKS